MKLRIIGANMTEVEAVGARVLFSYATPVAAYVDGTGYVKTEKNWSRTTSKHIGVWMRECGGRSDQAFIRPQEFFDTLLQVTCSHI